MELRATLDLEVVKEWGRRCAERRRGPHFSRYFMALVFLMAFLLPLLGVVEYFPYLAWVAALAGFCIFALRGVASAGIKCPNCGRTPTTAGQIPLNRMDFCPHCRYWLIDPWSLGHRNVRGDKLPAPGQFFDDSPVHSCSMGQESAEK